MSGYFVHGGTQYPFGQNSSQSQQNSGNQQPYYSNTSYPNSHAGGQGSQYSGVQSTGGNNYQNTQAGYGSNQYNSGASANNASNSYSGNVGGGGGGNSNLFGSNSFSGSSGFSGNNNKPGGFGNSYNFNKGSSGTSSNFSSPQNAQSSYEKALFNAANQYYSNRPRGGNRGARGNTTRGRGRGNYNRTQNTSTTTTTPKPIKASEIKAYLYAWCGQRKLKPEYEVNTEGDSKNIAFQCKLQVSGLDYVAKVESSNKKDAQSKAAWDFCDNLVKLGYMKQSDLPPRPAVPAPKSATGETTTQVGSLPPETQETIDEHGGWCLSNCRQRLNQFCQREHAAPNFKHTTQGPEHARSFLCELTVYVDALKKEFVAKESGSNKKQSTAICALSMVRQLYDANLIEKHGERMKHVTRGNLLGGKKPIKPVDEEMAVAPTPAVALGQKRKADDTPNPEQVDENGNWTFENSRQRLNQFCQANNIPCDVIYEEEGVPGNRTYTASLNMTVKPNDSTDEKELKATATGQSKKVAAQGCALSLLSQLYKLSLVEASPSTAGPNKKKQQRQRLDQTSPSFVIRSAPYSEFGPSPFPGPNMRGFGVVRKTPQQDIHLNEKHRLIYPSEEQLALVQRSVKVIEQALKEVAEQLTEPEPEADKQMESDDKTDASTAKKKSKLQGVMRVGSLAKGLLLKGDLDVNLVLLCLEVPTAKLLAKVAQLLPKHIAAADGDNFSIVTAMQEAAITAKNTTVKTETSPSMVCTITITLTSPVVRTPTEETAKDPPGALNKDKCLQALAELRHSKWFQACANSWPSCVIVIRILRELRRRVKEWKPISDWALELIAEKAIATSPIALSLGGSFLRCLEVIGSGVLLPGGPGVCDPCEREKVDATENLKKQEREAITSAAQEALRLSSFRQIHKVLGIEEIERKPFGKKLNAVTAPEAKAEPAAQEPVVKMES